MDARQPGWIGSGLHTSYKGKEMIKSTKPLKTNDKYVFGNDVKPEKGNNTTAKQPKNAGSAQKAAMKPKDVACK